MPKILFNRFCCCFSDLLMPKDLHMMQNCVLKLVEKSVSLFCMTNNITTGVACKDRTGITRHRRFCLKMSSLVYVLLVNKASIFESVGTFPIQNTRATSPSKTSHTNRNNTKS